MNSFLRSSGSFAIQRMVSRVSLFSWLISHIMRKCSVSCAFTLSSLFTSLKSLESLIAPPRALIWVIRTKMTWCFKVFQFFRRGRCIDEPKVVSLLYPESVCIKQVFPIPGCLCGTHLGQL